MPKPTFELLPVYMSLEATFFSQNEYSIRDSTFLEDVGASIQNSLPVRSAISSYNFFTRYDSSQFYSIFSLAKGGVLVASLFAVKRLSSTFSAVSFSASIGIIYSIAAAIFQHHCSNVEKEARVEAFNQLPEMPCKVQQQVSLVREFIQLRCPLLGQRYQIHQLHQAVTDITLAVRNDEKLSASWKMLLDTLNGMQVYYPDHIKRNLDFSETSIEQQRLKGRDYKVKVEALDLDSPECISDLSQIASINNDVFGGENDTKLDYFPLEAFLLRSVGKELSCVNEKNQLFNFIVARDEESNKILGFIHYYPGETFSRTVSDSCTDSKNSSDPVYVASLARDPGAASMGIGMLMLGELKACLPSARNVELSARESNEAAIALYLKSGFKVVGRQEGLCEIAPQEAVVELRLERTHS